EQPERQPATTSQDRSPRRRRRRLSPASASRRAERSPSPERCRNDSWDVRDRRDSWDSWQGREHWAEPWVEPWGVREVPDPRHTHVTYGRMLAQVDPESEISESLRLASRLRHHHPWIRDLSSTSASSSPPLLAPLPPETGYPDMTSRRVFEGLGIPSTQETQHCARTSSPHQHGDSRPVDPNTPESEWRRRRGSRRLCVSGLGPWVLHDALLREFDRFGAIRELDYVPGQTCAWVEFESGEAARAAVVELSGCSLGGSEHRLRVEMAGNDGRRRRDRRERQTRRRLPRRSSGGSGSEDVGSSPEFGSGRTKRSERRRARAKSGSDGDQRLRRRTEGVKVDEGGHRDLDNVIITVIAGSTCQDNGATTTDKTASQEINKSQPKPAAEPPLEVWEGQFILKNILFAARLLLLTGDASLACDLLPASSTPSLTIGHRVLLGNGFAGEVERRISQAGEAGYCVMSVVTSLPRQNPGPVKHLAGLEGYLLDKQAVGVVALPSTADCSALLLLFPNDLHQLLGEQNQHIQGKLWVVKQKISKNRNDVIKNDVTS
uniref:RRM domain-containing protein n=1 Tax=Eptatretus burgeri TaxID=7764 RepID=A0A8C4Q9T5_EPTBU